MPLINVPIQHHHGPRAVFLALQELPLIIVFVRHKLKPFSIFLALSLFVLVPSTNVEFTRVVPDHGPLGIRGLEDDAIFVLLHVNVVVGLYLDAKNVADVFGQTQQLCLVDIAGWSHGQLWDIESPHIKLRRSQVNLLLSYLCLLFCLFDKLELKYFPASVRWRRWFIAVVSISISNAVVLVPVVGRGLFLLVVQDLPDYNASSVEGVGVELPER